MKVSLAQHPEGNLGSMRGRPFARNEHRRMETPCANIVQHDKAVEQKQACRAMLRNIGLRPTRQRLSLGLLLFGNGDRHITADMLHEEAISARIPVSLATVYNTLHQFTESGLLRQVAVDGSKSYFETNTSRHHHFFVEGKNLLLDIPKDDFVLGTTPAPPAGYEITRIEVVVRLRRKAS